MGCYLWIAAALIAANVAAAQAPEPKADWTFEVGENEVTQYAIEDLCGLVQPPDWRASARFVSFPAKTVLPSSLDLRPYCTPIKSQGSCGSCWAFGTIGTLECAIKLRDGVTTDLSEQWLLNCNIETEEPYLLGVGTWGCNGGWFAHPYFFDRADACGGSGAVFESEIPYTAEDGTCGCSHGHHYWIDSWGYVAGEMDIPSVDAIKQAIMTYGPVTAAVRVNSAFSFYRSGVFNAHESGDVNHAIILVGWDDSLGANGAWILRNSWGATWGMDGYMYIEYGCSSVGLGTCFVEYNGAGQAAGPDIARQPGGGIIEENEPFTFHVEASGVGALHYQWWHNGELVGEDSEMYAINSATLEDSGTYQCRVSDLRGETESEPATLRVYPAGSVPITNAWGMLVLGLLCAVIGILYQVAVKR